MADLKPRIERLVGRLAGGRAALRPADAGFAEAVARLVAMPLDLFAREGQLLEVRVSWLDVTLWFVPDERDAEALGREGVSRGRVWTARELIALMALPDRTPECRASCWRSGRSMGTSSRWRGDDRHELGAGIQAGPRGGMCLEEGTGSPPE